MASIQKEKLEPFVNMFFFYHSSFLRFSWIKSLSCMFGSSEKRFNSSPGHNSTYDFNASICITYLLCASLNKCIRSDTDTKRSILFPWLVGNWEMQMQMKCIYRWMLDWCASLMHCNAHTISWFMLFRIFIRLWHVIYE